MLLLLLAFLGGTLTILSPCVLPVVPFVFAQSGKPFRSNGLPTLVGMALTFTLVASAAAVGGGWIVRANQVGRAAALVLLAAFGLALLFPTLGDRLTRPFVAIGGRLQQRADARAGIGGALLLGVAIGFLWAPCAGPVLGLILTGAALGGANAHTTLLLFAFAAGAATSLAIAIAAGARVFAALKRGLGAEEWIRRGLGIAVLAGVAAVALGLDTGILAKLSLASTSPTEQRLVDRFARGPVPRSASTTGAADASGPDQLPSFSGATGWLNSAPLTAAALHGHVVLIDVWTYSCINCLRTVPFVKQWANEYGPDGLVVIGVHSPEFAFERDSMNVAHAARDLGVTYPVALDNGYAIWRALGNEYWPAEYLYDTAGHLRYHDAGEGHNAATEREIRALLTESGHPPSGNTTREVVMGGAEAPAAIRDVGSPETYVGYRRAERWRSTPAVVRDSAQSYSVPDSLARNAWGLSGTWRVGPEAAVLTAAPGRVVFRFHARDLHLVLGPGPDGMPIRFRVRIDGQPPMGDHGSDVSADGRGTVVEQRLYQLIRQQGAVTDHTFEIEFLDPGVSVYAFTFG
jgi:cytochrome c biogenesis protein CcdA/thiol-disulfide isomerase/thioredoxin